MLLLVLIGTVRRSLFVCWIAAIFLAWLISSPRALAGFDFDVEGRSKLARYVGSFLAVGSFLPTSTVPTDSNHRSVDNGTLHPRDEDGRMVIRMKRSIAVDPIRILLSRRRCDATRAAPITKTRQR